jgi:hypothetical protein
MEKRHRFFLIARFRDRNLVGRFRTLIDSGHLAVEAQIIGNQIFVFLHDEREIETHTDISTDVQVKSEKVIAKPTTQPVDLRTRRRPKSKDRIYS